MNLEMHLHLNSELASNEFLTEFALNLHLKSERPSGFDLVRLSREQATVGKPPCKYERGGHALTPHPLILKWVYSPPPPTHTHTPPPPPPPPPPLQSSQVVQSAALFARMKSENTRSVLLSSVYNVYDHILFLLINCR